MATISLSLTVPDNKAQEILDAFATHYGYDESLGLTKTQFLRQEVIEFVRSAYVAEKVKAAELQARQLALQEANNVPIT